jgi:hypothetical protein
MASSDWRDIGRLRELMRKIGCAILVSGTRPEVGSKHRVAI